MAEILVALFILALTLLAVFSLISSTVLAGSHAEVQTQASHLALSIIDQQRSRPFQELEPSGPVVMNSVPVSGAVLQPTMEFVSRGPLATEVRVTVGWAEKGKRSEVRHATVIAKVVR